MSTFLRLLFCIFFIRQIAFLLSYIANLWKHADTIPFARRSVVCLLQTRVAVGLVGQSEPGFIHLTAWLKCLCAHAEVWRCTQPCCWQNTHHTSRCCGMRAWGRRVQYGGGDAHIPPLSQQLFLCIGRVDHYAEHSRASHRTKGGWVLHADTGLYTYVHVLDHSKVYR